MVNHSAAALDATFAALADPTRRAILARLAQEPDASVGEIARPFAMSAPAISKHLAVLEAAGLLARRRDGRVHHCRLVAAPMQTANDWIARYRQFWEGRLDSLERYLERSEPKQEDSRWTQTRQSSPSRASSKARRRTSSGRGRNPS
jgi:DNA-binding transcriptional ArsR family regulator